VSIEVIYIFWVTAGPGCDGDTIAMAAATQPSIQDIVLGIIPGLPKVRFRNPVLATEKSSKPGTRRSSPRT
jgi:hydrogenase small subunit